METARWKERYTARIVLVAVLAGIIAAALPSAAQQAAASSKKEFREFTWVRKTGVSESACRLECQSACLNHSKEYCPIQLAWMSVCKKFSEHQDRCRRVEVQVRECTSFLEEHEECVNVWKKQVDCQPLEATRLRCAHYPEASQEWEECVGSNAGAMRRCRSYFERIQDCHPHLVTVVRCENVTRELVQCQVLPQELTDPNMPTLSARSAYLERVCRAVREAAPACGNPTGQCDAGCRVRCR